MLATLPLDALTLLLCPDEPRPLACAQVELAAPLVVTVDYHYSPGTPDTLYRPNGDPGDQGDPEELELYHVVSRTIITLAGDGVTVTIDPGTNLLPFLSTQGAENMELDLLRWMGEPDADGDDA